jgi:thiol-disulfide isomerase/thioredoxin
MKRRQVAILAGAGLAAAGAGVGWQVWRQRGEDGDAEALWTMRFPRPEGGELVMAELRGRPLLLNFWATWCPPCVKEMPELDRFGRSFAARQGVVVGLAVDGPTPVREFLQKVPIGFAIGLAGFEGSDLSRQLGNTQGALPFSALIDAGGRVVQRKLGETSFDELTRWAQGL